MGTASSRTSEHLGTPVNSVLYTYIYPVPPFAPGKAHTRRWLVTSCERMENPGLANLLKIAAACGGAVEGLNRCCNTCTPPGTAHDDGVQPLQAQSTAAWPWEGRLVVWRETRIRAVLTEKKTPVKMGLLDPLRQGNSSHKCDKQYCKVN